MKSNNIIYKILLFSFIPLLLLPASLRAQAGEGYLSPFDIRLGEELPEPYRAVDCQLTGIEGAQDMEQCRVEPDLSRMADTLTIVRLKPSNKVYIVSAEKYQGSEEENKRFMQNEYNRHLLQYDQALEKGGSLLGEEYTGWRETERGTSGNLIDTQRNIRIFFLADEEIVEISYMLLAPEAIKSNEAYVKQQAQKARDSAEKLRKENEAAAEQEYGTVIGKLISSESGTPPAGEFTFLVKGEKFTTRNGKLGDDGRFYLQQIPAGADMMLMIRKTGYETLTRTIDVPAGDTLHIGKLSISTREP